MAATRLHICLSVTPETDAMISALSSQRRVSRSAVVAQIIAEEVARANTAGAEPVPEPMFAD